MEPGAVFYLQVSGGAGQALRTPGGLVGTSSVHSAKSCRACLEAACGTTGRRGSGGLLPCSRTLPQHTPCALLNLPLLGLLSPQTPFSLTLRLLDAYILEGERMLTAMAYTIVKIHQSE